MSLDSTISRRLFFKRGAAGAVVLAAGPQFLRAADKPERSLSFYNLHTTEKLKLVYWAGGDYVAESLVAIDHHLRDYRTGTVHEIDRRLLDLLWKVRNELDTTEPFHVISGY